MWGRRLRWAARLLSRLARSEPAQAALFSKRSQLGQADAARLATAAAPQDAGEITMRIEYAGAAVAALTLHLVDGSVVAAVRIAPAFALGGSRAVVERGPAAGEACLINRCASCGLRAGQGRCCRVSLAGVDNERRQVRMAAGLGEEGTPEAAVLQVNGDRVRGHDRPGGLDIGRWKIRLDQLERMDRGWRIGGNVLVGDNQGTAAVVGNDNATAFADRALVAVLDAQRYGRQLLPVRIAS